MPYLSDKQPYSPMPQPAPVQIYPGRPLYGRAGSDNAGSTGTEALQGGLFEYLRILRRRKGTVILIAFVGALMGFLSTLPQTPIYQAHTSLEIVALNDNFLNIKDVSPFSQSGSNVENADIQTQIRIFQSESLMERVLAKFKRPDNFVPPANRISAWRKALNLPTQKPDDAYESSLKYAIDSLRVRASGQTRILEISVDSPDPQTAANFANALSAAFIDQNLEARWKTTEHTTEWLGRQLDEMRIKLERSEDRLQEYARKAGLLFTSDKTNIDEDKLRQVQVTLSAAQADRISKQSRYETAATSSPATLPDILSDEGLREYSAKITELRRQLAELSPTYTPNHPKVKRVEAQIATIQAAFDQDRNDILKRIKNDYEEAVHKERLLSDNYAEQARLVSGEGEKAVQYNILKREVDSNRAVYDAMLQQLNSANIASALRASNIRVVDAAKVPNRPYKPDAPHSAAIGLVSGLFLGLTFVVVRERADRAIQQPGDTTFYLNTRELGVIPSSRVENRKAPKLISPVAAPGSMHGVELVSARQKQSSVAEAFRSTLISIMFSGDDGTPPGIILLTSPNPSEGKSTLVCNLGIAIAEVGNRVLLIDADFRRPRLHDVFGLKNSPGLSDMLRNRTPVRSREAVESLQATGIPNLSILASGAANSAAMSILYGTQMPELLKELREQFDTILIDTPPMLQIPDARLLARLSDRVILVVRAGKTTRDAAFAAIQRLQEDGANVLGAILNDWNPKYSAPGYGYNGYGRAYGGYYSNSSSGAEE